MYNRGLNSYDVLMLARDSNWFFPIMGNHELFTCINLYKNGGHWLGKRDGSRDGREFNLWHKTQGGGWLEKLTDEQLNELIDFVFTLPVGGSVITPSGGVVGLIHADPLPDWNDLKLKLSNCTIDDLIAENNLSVGIPSMLQSRNRLKRFSGGDIDESGFKVENIDRVYVGHTITYNYFDVDIGTSVSVGDIQYMDGGSWFNLGSDYPIVELL